VLQRHDVPLLYKRVTNEQHRAWVTHPPRPEGAG
jgi:hypothetical protein